jgi:hypothetical protein
MDIQPGRITCTRLLPDSYRRIWGLDLAQDRTTAVVLNLISIPLFAVAGWLFLHIASVLRPDIANLDSIRKLSIQPLILYLDFVGVIAFVMVLHEAIHGLFFWIFTRSKPVFGIKLLFAYAGAPEWYVPRNQYSIVGLAPLILISVGGFLVIPLTSLYVAQPLLLGMVMNAAGAMGDIYVCVKVLRLPPDVLIQDTGFVFDVYGKSA